MKKLIALLAAMLLVVAFAACSDDDTGGTTGSTGTTGTTGTTVEPVKISTVFSSDFGWATAAVWNVGKYIVLYNAGTGSQDLSGWSLQFHYTGQTAFDRIVPLSGTIAAGKYLLIADATNVSCTNTSGSNNVAVDLDTTTAQLEAKWSYKGAGIALCSTINAVSNAASASIVDAFGFLGSDRTPTFFETAYWNTSASGDNTGVSSFVRKASGTTDTGNNTADFDKITDATFVAPQNSSN
jgi:hypothetical protein